MMLNLREDLKIRKRVQEAESTNCNNAGSDSTCFCRETKAGMYELSTAEEEVRRMSNHISQAPQLAKMACPIRLSTQVAGCVAN